MTKKQEAKECAIQDIQQELLKQNRCFISYIEKLDPVMEELVNRYETMQNSFCISAYSKEI